MRVAPCTHTHIYACLSIRTTGGQTLTAAMDYYPARTGPFVVSVCAYGRTSGSPAPAITAARVVFATNSSRETLYPRINIARRMHSGVPRTRTSGLEERRSRCRTDARRLAFIDAHRNRKSHDDEGLLECFLPFAPYIKRDENSSNRVNRTQFQACIWPTDCPT